MSITGIGSQGSGNLSQILSSLLTRLDSASTTSASTGETTTSQTTTTIGQDANLTGATKPSLSGMILGALIGLQGENSEQSSTASDAVGNLFSSMDADSDGSVSQSELESYLGSVGGTTDQADTLYSLLAGDSEGISESEMSSAAPPPPPPGGGGPGGPGGPGGGGPGGPGGTEESSGSDLVSLFDTDDDDAVSENEFTAFMTAHGGTEADAKSVFAALSSDDSDTLTASDFSDAVNSLQNSYTNDPYASVVSLMDLFGANASNRNSVSVSA